MESFQTQVRNTVTGIYSLRVYVLVHMRAGRSYIIWLATFWVVMQGFNFFCAA